MQKCDHVSLPPNTKSTFRVIVGRLKEIDTTINTLRIVSMVVSTLEAKTIRIFFINLTKKQKFPSGKS